MTFVYLRGAGNNSVNTGAGSATVYDQGTGANTIRGGAGGGTYYAGVDSAGNAYATKGDSNLLTTSHNFSAYISGYSIYTLTDFGLSFGTYRLGMSGVQSVTLNAASASTANSFTLSSWSGNATLNGLGGNNTLAVVPNSAAGGVNDVLSDSSLQITGGLTQSIGLNDIQTANLGGASKGASSFDVSSWTGNGAADRVRRW